MSDRAATSPDASERRHTAVAMTALVLGAFAMGASPIFVRLADVGPYASAFWRVFLALPFLAVWAFVESGGRFTIGRNRLDRSVWLSGLLFTGDLFFWHLAILSTTVANATFLATISPIWVALGAWLLLNEKIGGNVILGVALCLLGGSALLGESYGFVPERLLGDVYGVVTSFFFGAYVLAIRRARAQMGPGMLAFVSTAITAACLFVIACALEPTLIPRTWNGAAALLALAIVSQVLGQGLLAVALGTLPATFSSLVIFLEAVAAAALGWMVLNERLGMVQLLGGILILIGIWIGRPRPARAEGVAL